MNPFADLSLEDKIYPCLQCGFCCTISACGYGSWNATKHRCDYLTKDSKCGKYNEIKEDEKSVRFPMMGVGCSSPLCNDMREKKMLDINTKPVIVVA